jgi:surfactin synthase thioesterase subunit
MKTFVQVMRKAPGRKQIVMFPFGGGSGYSYVSLINEIPRDTGIIVINPPGHMMNGGKPLETISSMVYIYSKELLPLLKETTLFFGHSIGGVVAYEVCKELQDTIPIKHMVISSVNPPHRTMDNVDLHSGMETGLLVDKCTQLGGVPRIFMEEPLLLDGFITGLRADLKALEHYTRPGIPGEPGKLGATATVLYSDRDYIVNPDKVKEWERYLSCDQFIPFTGDHFYLFEESNRKTVARILNRQAGRLAGC